MPGRATSPFQHVLRRSSLGRRLGGYVTNKRRSSNDTELSCQLTLSWIPVLPVIHYKEEQAASSVSSRFERAHCSQPPYSLYWLVGICRMHGMLRICVSSCSPRTWKLDCDRPTLLVVPLDACKVEAIILASIYCAVQLLINNLYSCIAGIA